MRGKVGRKNRAKSEVRPATTPWKTTFLFFHIFHYFLREKKLGNDVAAAFCWFMMCNQDAITLNAFNCIAKTMELSKIQKEDDERTCNIYLLPLHHPSSANYISGVLKRLSLILSHFVFFSTSLFFVKI